MVDEHQLEEDHELVVQWRQVKEKPKLPHGLTNDNLIRSMDGRGVYIDKTILCSLCGEPCMRLDTVHYDIYHLSCARKYDKHKQRSREADNILDGYDLDYSITMEKP